MSVEEDFDIRAELGVDAPCYVRKVDRPTHCGTKEDTPDHRVALIKDNVLSLEGGIVSVFFVTSARDVARAAIALNFHRTGGNRVEDLCLLAFTTDEFEGVTKDQTADSFACHWAMECHWNVTLSAPDQDRIANILAFRQRFPKNFTKSKMKDAFAAGRADGCLSTDPQSKSCVCTRD